MKTKHLLTIAGILLPLCLMAQNESSQMEYDFRSRTSASVDWKIIKGLHLEGGYELRTKNNFSRIDRHQLSLGIDWSPLKYLNVGGGYIYIGNYSSDRTFQPRHRFYLDIIPKVEFGNWKLSLRERLQLTHNAYEFNTFQQTPNFIELKSRLKLSYKGFKHLEPYAFAELRNCFNAPTFSCNYNTTTGKYTDYKFLGYNDVYINRIRSAIGLQWKINQHNKLDMRLMADYYRDKDIDTNAEGTKLKSYCWDKLFASSIVIGYTFSF